MTGEIIRGLILCIVILGLQIVSAAEYFVSPSGSEVNDGTEQSPWPTIGFAMSQIRGGDVVTVLPGTYPEAVVIDVSGPAGQPTVLRSQHKWAALIQNSPSHGIYVADGITNILIDGLQVAASAIDGVKIGSDATVRNCWIHHSSGQGITAIQTRGVLLERNLIELNGSDPVFDHGIYLSGTNNVVRSCVIRWNKCYGCQFYADPPYSSAECQFYNNLVYSNRNGLAVWSAAGQTNYIFNNTLAAGRFVLHANGGVLCVSNNILLGRSARWIFSAEDGAEFRADYNVIWAAGRRRGPHDVMVIDAGVVNPTNGLFWLAAASPARGAAAGGLAPPVDFFGYEQNQALDVGAFGYRPGLAADRRVLDPSPAMPDYWQTNVLTNP